MDLRGYPILYVDDEVQNLVAVRYLLESEFTLLTTTKPEEALSILENTDVAVLLADQRMPGMTGVQLCERARALRPDTLRIIITAYADMHDAIEAINKGQVIRFLSKPFRNEELIAVMRAFLQMVHMQRAVKQMQVTLLSAAPQATAAALGRTLAHEIDKPHLALRASLPRAVDLTDAAVRERSDGPRQAQLLGEAKLAQGEAMEATQELGHIVRRWREGATAGRERASTDLARVADATVRIMRPEIERVARVQFQTEGTPMVAVDAAALGQLVTNLLMAAASVLGGDPVRERVIVLSVRPAGGQAQLSVTATGIDEGQAAARGLDRAEALFDPSHDPMRSESRLALAMVRALAGAAGGQAQARYAAGELLLAVELPLA